MKKFYHLAFILLAMSNYAQDTKIQNDSIAQAKEIEGVIIKAQRKKLFADKAVYTFGEEALKKARYANDLLKTLPELQFDPINNSVKSTKGGTTLFLINGVEATELQMRGIMPENVVRVEYYDNPPTRFATRADVVVNVVTRNPETGYSYGAELYSALNTGFVNGSAYANYTKGRNNIGLEYYINYRDYDNRVVNSSYEYDLLGSRYRTDENRKDHFGYTDHNLALRYTNVLTGNYVLQTKLNLNISDYFSHGVGGSLFSKDAVVEKHGLSEDANRNYVLPTLDIYFSKNLSPKDELSVNLVGSSFTTKNIRNEKEWVLDTNANVYDNVMNLKANQKSVVGELAYTHDFSVGKFSAGYRISNNNVVNELHNLVGDSQYEVNYLEQYMYIEFSGKKNKWMYRLGLGLTNINNKTEDSRENSWQITPKLILGYQLAKNQSLRFNASYKPQSPGSSALSSNVVQIAPNLVSKGNPYLKSQQKWNTSLWYALNNKYFDLNLNMFYDHINNAINQFFVPDDILGGYALTYQNVNYATKLGAQLSGSIKPFGNELLNLKVVITPAKETLKMKDGREIKFDYISNYFVINSEYKNFSLQYQLNFPVYTLEGAFLSTEENANHLFLKYKHNNWSFSTGMYWIGMPSEYKTKSLKESLVNFTSVTQIFNNKSMFIVGLSYDFAKGKKNEVDKKLNNDTAPPVTF